MPTDKRLNDPALAIHASVADDDIFYMVKNPTGAATQGSVAGSVIDSYITSSLADNFQPLDAGLTSISALTTAADKMIYTTALDTYAVADLTPFARTILASAQQAALDALTDVAGATDEHVLTKDTGTGNAIFKAAPSAPVTSVFGRVGVVTATGGDYTASEVTNAAAGSIAATDVQAAINELDAEKQPLDATLTALAAYNTNGLLAQTSADNFAGRTITGTANRLSVSDGDGVSGNPTLDIDSAYVGQATITTLGTITTGVWTGTDIAVADGGTGASDEGTARTNLGLVAGGAGDIWVEKAGDTMTGTLTMTTSGSSKAMVVGGSTTGIGIDINHTIPASGGTYQGQRMLPEVDPSAGGSIVYSINNNVRVVGSSSNGISELYAGWMRPGNFRDSYGGTVTNAYGAYIANATSNSSGSPAITNLYGIYVESMTFGGTNYSIRTGTGLVQFGDRITINQSSATGAFPSIQATQSNSAYHVLNALTSHNLTTTIAPGILIRHATSGTAAAGFGISYVAQLQSSTTAGQAAGRMVYKWIDATHATRASRGDLSSYYTSTERTSISWGSNSSASLLSFHAATPVIKQVITGSRASGAALADLLTKLATIGLITDSSSA